MPDKKNKLIVGIDTVLQGVEAVKKVGEAVEQVKKSTEGSSTYTSKIKLEGVDQATQEMNKLGAAAEKVTKAVETAVTKLGQASAAAAQTASRSLPKYDAPGGVVVTGATPYQSLKRATEGQVQGFLDVRKSVAQALAAREPASALKRIGVTQDDLAQSIITRREVVQRLATAETVLRQQQSINNVSIKALSAYNQIADPGFRIHAKGKSFEDIYPKVLNELFSLGQRVAQDIDRLSLRTAIQTARIPLVPPTLATTLPDTRLDKVLGIYAKQTGAVAYGTLFKQLANEFYQGSPNRSPLDFPSTVTSLSSEFRPGYGRRQIFTPTSLPANDPKIHALLLRAAENRQTPTGLLYPRGTEARRLALPSLAAFEASEDRIRRLRLPASTSRPGILGSEAGFALPFSESPILKGIQRIFQFFRDMGEGGFVKFGGITPEEVARRRQGLGFDPTPGVVYGGPAGRGFSYRPGGQLALPPAGATGRGGYFPPTPPGPPPVDLSAFNEFPQGPRGRTFGAAIQSLITYVSAATIIYSTLAEFQSALNKAVEFEEKLAQLRGILPSKSLSEQLLITQAVIDNASKYGKSITDVVDVAQALIQTGRSAGQVVNDLDAILKGATGLNISLNTSQELLIAMRSLTKDLTTGISGIDTDIFDRIAVAQERAAVSAEDLAQALRTIGPTAREIRGPFIGLVDEIDLVLASIGQIVQRTGVPGSQAATSLRNTLSRLGRPEVVRAVQNIGGVGLATPESQGKEYRPLLEILQDLSRAYKTLDTADRNRLLTQIAGSRQTNALIALLTNFDEVLNNAERSALAFGNAQERTGFVLDTTRNKLNKITTGLQAIGISFLQSSYVGGIFRTVLDGVASVFRFISSDIDSAVPKFLGFIAVMFGAVKAIRLFGSALLFSFGLRTAQQVGYLSLAFNGLGLTILNVATKIRAFLATNFLFAGLTAAIGPGGTFFAIAAALTGLIALALAFRKSLQPDKRLELSFLESSQLTELAAPKVEEFKAAATRIGVPAPELFEDLNQAAKSSIPILSQYAATLGKPFEKLTRNEILKTVFPILEQNVTGFREEIERATKGLSEQAAAAERVRIVMELVGKAAFYQSGVIQTNYNRLITQTDDLRNSVNATLAQLERSTTALAPRRFARGGVETTPSTISQIVAGVTGLNEKAGAAVELIINAGKETGVFSEALGRLELERNAGRLQTLGDAAIFFGKALEETVDPTEKAQLLNRVTTDLTEAFRLTPERLGLEQGLLAGMLGVNQENRGSLNKSIDETLVGAISRIKANSLRQLGGRDLLLLSRGLERGGTGVRALIADFEGVLLGVKNPLTEFNQELFFTVSNFEAAEEAAKKFGLSLGDITEQRLKSFKDLGVKAFQLPLNTFKQYLDAVQKLQEANVSLVKTEGTTLPAESEARIVEINRRDNLKVQIFRLTQTVAVLKSYLSQFGIAAEGQSLVDSVTGLVANTPELAGVNLQPLFNRIATEPGLSGPEGVQRLQEIIAEELDRILITPARQAVGNLLRGRGQVQLFGQQKLGEIDARAAISGARITQAEELATIGLRPIDAATIRIQTIERQRSLDLTIQQAKFEEQLALLRLEAGDLDKDAIENKRIALETANGEFIIKTNLNAETEKQLALEKAINDEQKKFTEQVQSNLTQRLSGVRAVLTDFDKLRKGSLKTILEPAGQNFLERQADILLGAFGPGGPLSKVGNLIGGIGESDPIVLAHTTGATAGAAILTAAIISAHATGAGIVAAGTGLATTGVGGGAFGGFQSLALSAVNSLGTPSKAAGSAKLSADLAKLKKDQLKQALGSLAGYLGGSAIGGGGQNAQLGASIGAAAGTLIPIPVLGPIIGGLAGGLLGGLFDKNKSEVQVTALEKIAANTQEQITVLENTNRLLEAQNLAFNVPSTFRLPSYGAQAFGGSTNSNQVNIEVNVVGGSSTPAQELGKIVSEAVADRLQKEFLSGGSYRTRTGY